MQVDYLIIGQGICGSFLGWELEKAGQSFLVIDDSRPYTASKVASGIINPVTGRRIVKTWMIDELLPFARSAYHEIGQSLGIQCIREIPVVDCFASAQMRLAFTDRLEKDSQYLSLPKDENDLREWINYDLGYGIIQPALLVDIRSILERQRGSLHENNRLLEERVDYQQIRTENSTVHYKDIIAQKIIFCDGIAGYANPFFPLLPFGLNKGEAMLVEIPGLPPNQIIKKGYNLVPWKDDIFWLGSTYLWEFDNDQPTDGFRRFAENWLSSTIRLPFRILEHWASVRPATLERKPFVGMHPLHNNIGILNGMGTKGCSLAPFFARQLVDHLLKGSPILAEANVQRFKKTLSR